MDSHGTQTKRLPSEMTFQFTTAVIAAEQANYFGYPESCRVVFDLLQCVLVFT